MTSASKARRVRDAWYATSPVEPRPVGNMARELKEAHSDILRLRRKNQELSKALFNANQTRADARELIRVESERADLFERRYIGVCSLLRMVLDQFDTVSTDELLGEWDES